MNTCDEFPTLLRQRDAGEMDHVEAHLAGCPACAEAWADLDVLTALGQALPDGRPDARRRESVRTQLLARAEATRPRRTGRWIALAATIILSAGVGYMMLGRGDAPTPLARVQSEVGAIYSVRRDGLDERVELTEGRISITVPPLESGQRFTVVTADAEVEVRGTTFSVRAIGGRLDAVEVVEGLVEVRPRGAAIVSLGANERWSPPVAGVAEPVVVAAAEPTARPEAPIAPERPAVAPSKPSAVPPKPSVTPSKPSAMPSKPSATPPEPAPVEAPEAPDAGVPSDAAPAPASPQTIRFDAGWQALRAGRPGAAVNDFAAAAGMQGPLREDATWWHAVALGRANRDADARAAVTRFIATWPGSPRRAEASVMLGWIQFSAGEVDAADRSFRAGLKARRAAVRSSAQSGLDAITQWREAR